MKIKIEKLIYYILLLIVIFNLHMLDFGDISSIYRIGTAGISVMLAILCLGNRYIRPKIKSYTKFINKFVVIFFIYYILESIYGLLFSDIGWTNYVKRIVPYMYIFLSYPIILILQEKEASKRFLSTIFTLSFIALLMKSIVWWQYNYYGKDIMHYILYENGNIWQRNGKLRIRATCLNSVYIASCIVKFYAGKVKEKIIGISAILFFIWYANYVMQSRALMITIVISIFFALALYRDTVWKKLIIIVSLSVFGVIFLQSAYFNNLISGLNIETYSTSIRLEGFFFYISQMKGHWLLGLIPINTYEGIRSFNWRYYLSDLGMFSILFEYGIIGFCIFNIPIFRMISVYIRSKSGDLYLLSLIPAMILFSYMSNNIYLVENILALPIIMAYVEVFNIQHKDVVT